MAILTREEILSKGSQLAYQDVPCPEWGGDVRIYAMSGSEREDYENKFVVKDAKGKTTWQTPPSVRELLVSCCARDAQGARLFTEADIATLSKMSASALIRCAEAAMRLAGLSDGDIKELTKDFETGQA